MWVYTCIIIVFNKNRLLVSSFGDIYINLIKLFFGGFGGRILEGFHRRQMTQRVKNRLAVFSIKIKSAFDVHRNVSLLKKEKN